MTPDEAVDKFRPWFPHLRDIPLPDEPMPKMTPREALLILEWSESCLYDGGSGAQAAEHAFSVLEDLINVYERNLVIPE